MLKLVIKKLGFREIWIYIILFYWNSIDIVKKYNEKFIYENRKKHYYFRKFKKKKF